MNSTSALLVASMLLLILSFRAAIAQPLLLPLQPGMAVASCLARLPDDPVIGVVDIRNPPPDRVGLNWTAPMEHGPGESWTGRNLGQVFGLALDESGNIYATATTSYGTVGTSPAFGPGGAGGIYRIDGVTGSIRVLASLPNRGSGLGNLCYDREVDQLYVTNFEDGRIYRLDTDGSILSTYDPFTPDDGSAGFAPLGERLWGIATYYGRVYYAVWRSDRRLPHQMPGNEIRSVAIDAAGEFIRSSDRREVLVPGLHGGSYSNPVSDLEFSAGGRMLVAERSMLSDATPDAHLSRLLEYRGSPGNWGDPVEFIIGVTAVRLGNSNCAGGAAYGFGRYDPFSNTVADNDSVVWTTGDALRYPAYNPDRGEDFVYGLAGMPAGGNTPMSVASTSYYVDLDGNTETGNKRELGDVEVFRGCDAASIVFHGDSIMLDSVGFVLPVTLDTRLDDRHVTRMVVELQYQSGLLRFRSSESDLGRAIHGTLIDGWIATVLEDGVGRFVVRFVAPDPTQALSSYGGLLNLAFDYVSGTAGTKGSGPIVITIQDAVEECLNGATTVDSTAYLVCRARNRLMTVGLEKYALEPPQPNPFNPTTRIDFTLGLDGETRVEILDGMGQVVEQLVDEHLEEGEHGVTWHAGTYPSGLYYCRVQSGTWSRVIPLVLVR